MRHANLKTRNSNRYRAHWPEPMTALRLRLQDSRDRLETVLTGKSTAQRRREEAEETDRMLAEIKAEEQKKD